MAGLIDTMKVIHLPTSVGGNSWGLSRGERQLGISSDVLYESNNWIDYPCDILAPVSNNVYKRYLSLVPLLMELINKYDVFHFNYGKTLFDWYGVINNIELPLLKGKKVCVTYNGCDARQKYKTIEREDICCCKYEDCYGGVCNSIKQDRIKEKRIKKFERFGAHFFSLNPDLMHYLPQNATFLPYTICHWDRIERLREGVQSKKVIKVVHAPTNRTVKGTDAVIRAVENLKKAGNQVELTLVEKMSNDEALKKYAEADIVVDQLRIGWYGAFAVEVMRMGKPVVAYINENDLKFIPSEMSRDCKEAIINANEYTIEDVLGRYIDNREELKQKCDAQWEYVNKWHNPVYVASITKKIYEGDTKCKI